MNSQVSHITRFSPYETVYHQTPPDLFNFDFDPENRYKELLIFYAAKEENYG